MLRSLLLGVWIAVSAAGCATAPEERLGADEPRQADTTCLQSTGTHIRLRQGQCSIQPGRAYSRSDIARTGASSTADALQRLDLSVRVGQ